MPERARSLVAIHRSVRKRLLVTMQRLRRGAYPAKKMSFILQVYGELLKLSRLRTNAKKHMQVSPDLKHIGNIADDDRMRSCSLWVHKDYPLNENFCSDSLT